MFDDHASNVRSDNVIGITMTDRDAVAAWNSGSGDYKPFGFWDGWHV